MSPAEPGKLETCAVESGSVQWTLDTERWTLLFGCGTYIYNTYLCTCGFALFVTVTVDDCVVHVAFEWSASKCTCHCRFHFHFQLQFADCQLPQGSQSVRPPHFPSPGWSQCQKPQKHAKGLSPFIAAAKLQSIMLHPCVFHKWYGYMGMGVLVYNWSTKNRQRFSRFSTCVHVLYFHWQVGTWKTLAMLFIKMHG